MKIAIIGGAGFVGSHLTRAYMEAGHDVLVLDSLVHGAREAVDTRARFYHLDCRAERLREVLQHERPQVVSYHVGQRLPLPPGAGLLQSADVHIRGLLNVLEGCVSAQVGKLIFASGGNSLYRAHAQGEPLGEEEPACPRCPLDISRIAGEWYVRYYAQEYRLPYLILRYADIYGERDPLRAWHPLSTFLSQLSIRERPVMREPAEVVRDHIFIDDVVEANLRALESGRNETLHISSGQGHSLGQLYQTAARLLGREIQPLTLTPESPESGAIVLDNRRAARVLSWRPQTDLPTGVRLAIGRLCQERIHAPSAAAEEEEGMPVEVMAARIGQEEENLAMV